MLKLVLYHNSNTKEGSYTLMIFKDDRPGFPVRTFGITYDKKAMLNHCKLLADYLGVPFFEAEA